MPSNSKASPWTGWCVLVVVLFAMGHWRLVAAQDPEWVTVDEFQLESFPGNKLWCVPSAAFADSRGTVFIGGHCRETGSTFARWVVRRSADGGRTWATVEDLFIQDETYHLIGFAEDARGHVYAAGYITKREENGPVTGLVRQSVDGGETWVTIDEVAGFGGSTIGTDASRTMLFATGQGGIRRSLDAGSSWEWVDGEPGGRFFSGSSITSTDGAVFVSGSQCPALGCALADPSWVLKRTTDGGKEWTSIHESSNWSGTLYASPLGDLYALGPICSFRVGEEAIPCVGTRLRRLSPDGTQWEEILTDRTDCVVEGMAFDPAGTLYSVGCAKYGERGLLEGGVWLTKKSTDGGRTWQLSDRFVAPGNTAENWATAVTVDRDGNVYVCGPQHIDRPRQVWFVRKLPAPTSERLFRRADSDATGSVNLTDAVFTLDALFRGGQQPGCPDAADADDDGKLGITDAIYTLGYLFQSSPRPPEPGPTDCGEDPSSDVLAGCDYEPSKC